MFLWRNLNPAALAAVAAAIAGRRTLPPPPRAPQPVPDSTIRTERDTNG